MRSLVVPGLKEGARQQKQRPPLVKGRPNCQLVNNGEIFGGRFAVLSLLQFVRDFLPFIEGVQACLLNSRDVNERIARAVFGLDESVTFSSIEPFYSTSRHRVFL